MPPLKVEYAKSSRSRCTLKECGKFILKGELRIGTGNMMPGASELSYKWRHLCCFTKRQLASVSTVEALQGYDDCTEEDKGLLRRLVKGELIGDSSLLGRTSDPAGVSPTTSPKKTKKAAAAVTPASRKRGRIDDDYGDDDSDATVTDDDADGGGAGRGGATVQVLPMCPHGTECYRKNSEHFKQYRHPGDPLPEVKPKGTPAVGKGTTAGSTTPTATVAVGAKMTASGKKICPFGALCFRTDASHRRQFAHEE